jgi:hypothetical protein
MFEETDSVLSLKHRMEHTVVCQYRSGSPATSKLQK